MYGIESVMEIVDYDWVRYLLTCVVILVGLLFRLKPDAIVVFFVVH